MKIQCGVCDKDEATVYCVADEAALCDACDCRVHHANKLAGKHQRFSLLQPSPKEAPLCDICKERRAFLFCLQDRAILCRDCDIPIHKANEHTKKHNRFFLTGVKLSATSAIYSSSTSSPSPAAASTTSVSDLSDAVPTFNPQSSSTKNPVSLAYQQPTSKPTATIASTTAQAASDHSQWISGSTSSISEYLMGMSPAWLVEDFLDTFSPNGFCKASEDDVQPFWGADLGQNLYSFSSAATENTTLWVPQIPPPAIPTPNQTYPSSDTPFDAQMSFKEPKDFTVMKPSRELSDDNSFAVPQISSHSIGFKRSRTLW